MSSGPSIEACVECPLEGGNNWTVYNTCGGRSSCSNRQSAGWHELAERRSKSVGVMVAEQGGIGQVESRDSAALVK